MDFDDLLLKTNELLYKFPEVLAKYQNRFKYILVDEYQDTNHSQYLIVKALAAKYENICNYIHLPVQSGNSRILKLMNRTYDADWYRERVESIYRIIPECTISADIITGFCSETEEEHQDTLKMMEWAGYIMSYMFYYSERPGTLAAKKYEDDISLEVKKRRLAEVVELQGKLSHKHNLISERRLKF